ncbi:MAG: FprA family A-type flavoprotein, partial [Bacteroidales bacterium]|nr:FprA family A-type flavoprotein [Bacteroidales bacterium]
GDPAQAVALAFVYGRTVLAACSYDAGLFTPALHFILDLQSKAWQNRKVGLVENGSWAPSAGRIMREMFSGMKGIELVEPLVSIRSRLKSQDIPALEALADSIIA